MSVFSAGNKMMPTIVKLSTAYSTPMSTSTKMVTPTFFFATSMDAPKAVSYTHLTLPTKA